MSGKAGVTVDVTSNLQTGDVALVLHLATSKVVSELRCLDMRWAVEPVAQALAYIGNWRVPI